MKQLKQPLFSLGVGVLCAWATTLDAHAGARHEKGIGLIQQGDEVLFRIEYEKIRTAQDVETYLYRHLGSDKSIIIEERTEMGAHGLKTYTLRNRQTGLRASLRIHNGVATYTRTIDGTQKVTTEKVSADIPFVSGPQFRTYLATQKTELKEKGSIRFLLPVLERGESIEFEVVRRDEVVHEMRPANPLYRMFVRKILIELAPQTNHIQQVYGRIMPMLKEGSSWKTVEAMTVYPGR